MQATITSQKWLPAIGAPYASYEFTLEIICDDCSTTTPFYHQLTPVELALVNSGALTINELATAYAEQVGAQKESCKASCASIPKTRGESIVSVPLTLAVLLVTAVLVGVGIFSYTKVKARKEVHPYHCTDAGMTYEKAVALYESGARYLDLDHDGIPCKQLFDEELKDAVIKLTTVTTP